MNKEVEVKLTPIAIIQIMLLLSVASILSMLIKNIDNSLLLYLPTAFSIVFVHWFGLRVLPVIYLVDILMLFVWKAEGSVFRYLLVATHEPAVTFASWLLSRNLVQKFKGFKDTSHFTLFVFFGIVISSFVNCPYTYHFSFVNGDLEKVLLIWLSDFITIFCIAVPFLHFFAPVNWKKGLGIRPINFSLSSLRGSLRELGFLFLFFLGLNFLIDFNQYWFVYGVCSIVVAVRWGFRMTILTNGILYGLSYLIPLFLQVGEVQFLQPSSKLIYVHVGMAAMFYISAIIGRAVSDFRIKEKELNLQKEKLEEANEQLKKTNSDLDRFVYSVSHDISAPLKSIKGLVGLFKLESSSNSPSSKLYIDKIEVSILKLENFISEVLDHSRASRKEVKLEKIDLKPFFTEAISNLQYLDNFNRITFSFNLKTHIIESDPFLLKVVVSNLLSNAIKYQKTVAGHNPEILISSATMGNEIEIHISDNGEGISEKYKEKIFEMFYRGTLSSSGSGLGLYIAREAAEKLGGKITVKTTLGEGSTFTLTLTPNPNYSIL